MPRKRKKRGKERKGQAYHAPENSMKGREKKQTKAERRKGEKDKRKGDRGEGKRKAKFFLEVP